MRKRKEMQVWTVRNKAEPRPGFSNRIGTFGALSAKDAIRAAVHASAVTASQFRSMRPLRSEDLVAAVEG